MTKAFTLLTLLISGLKMKVYLLNNLHQTRKNDAIEDPIEEPRELSNLKKRRAEKIRRNMERFEELGFINAHKYFRDPATPQGSVLWNKTGDAHKCLVNVPTPMRMSPRLMELQMDAQELSTATHCSSTWDSRIKLRIGCIILNV